MYSLIYARCALGAPKIGISSRNVWKVPGIGQLECVSYDVVCGMFYYADNEKALINEDDRQDRELRKLVIETHPGRFWNFFPLNLCTLL
jgi:hypothetical protein